MATWYVATGVSGGDGSSGSPWNWDELCSNETSLGDADEVQIASGTHTATGPLTLTIDRVKYLGDTTTRPVIQAQNTMTHMVTRSSGARHVFSHLELDDNNYAMTGTSAAITRHASICHWLHCKITGATTNRAYVGTGQVECYRCEATANYGFNNVTAHECCAHGCNYQGFSAATPAYGFHNCVAYNNRFGFGIQGTNDCYGCLGFANDLLGDQKDIWGILTNNHVGIHNCIMDECDFDATTHSYAYDSLYRTLQDQSFAFEYNNTVMTADPFVDAVNGDFRLTAAAKQTSYSGKLYEILAGLVNVPGITLDSDLVGPNPGSSISPAFLR